MKNPEVIESLTQLHTHAQERRGFLDKCVRLRNMPCPYSPKTTLILRQLTLVSILSSKLAGKNRIRPVHGGYTLLAEDVETDENR